MGLGLKRADLRLLAEEKLADAELLLAHHRYANSYYLAGYAIEIALKACISAQFVAEVIPEKTFVAKIYTHEFKSLIALAGLSGALKTREDGDPQFAANFAFAAQWSPEVRYSTTDVAVATRMIAAITDASLGVLPWIKLYW